MREAALRETISGGNRYILGDCVAGCREFIPDSSVDLVIADPPYGIAGHTLDKHYNRKEAYVLDGYVEVAAEDYAEFSRAWIAEAARILRPGGQIFIISGYTRLFEVLGAIRKTPLREVNHLVWKYNFGVFTRRKFISSHYHLLLYAKPPLSARTFVPDCRFGLEERNPDGSSPNYADREDVWAIPREYKHGTARNKNTLPLALVVKMLQYCSLPGDLVCDLFLGGFTTARACIGLKRRLIGFELSPIAYEHQLREIASLQPGYLLDSLRQPAAPLLLNSHKPWTAAEKELLRRDYAELRAAGHGKAQALELLGRRYLRGKWALMRVLRGT